MAAQSRRSVKGFVQPPNSRWRRWPRCSFPPVRLKPGTTARRRVCSMCWVGDGAPRTVLQHGELVIGQPGRFRRPSGSQGTQPALPPQCKGSCGDEAAHRGLRGSGPPRRRAEGDRRRLDHRSSACSASAEAPRQAIEQPLATMQGQLSAGGGAPGRRYETVAVTRPVASPRSGGPDLFQRARVTVRGWSGQLLKTSVSAACSAELTVRPHLVLAAIQSVAYWHQ